MKEWLTKALVPLFIAASAMPATAQEAHAQFISRAVIEVDEGKATPVIRATTARNVWAFVTLLADLKKDADKPVPLYGYKLPTLDEQILSKALASAALGKVHVAVMQLGNDKDSRHKAKAIKVSLKANRGQFANEVTAVLPVTTKGTPFVAFSQPLDGKTAVAKLWSNPSMTKVAMEATPIISAGAATNVPANPKITYKPIPLYGYKLSKLDERLLSYALALAALGKVHVAITKLGDDKNSLYEAKVLKVPLKAEQKEISEAVMAAFPATAGGIPSIAFTRPLRGNTAVAKFITTPHLWSRFAAER